MIARMICKLFGHRWCSWFAGATAFERYCDRCEAKDYSETVPE